MVRPARAEDAQAIARMHVATWQAAYRHALPAETLDSIDVNARERRWKEFLAGDSATFVGEIDGEIIGFVSVGESRDQAGVGEVFAIYVLPHAWGTGLGTALIERGEDELRARGFTAATLNVLADNPRARRFYERQGWVRGETFTDRFLGQDVELARHRKVL